MNDVMLREIMVTQCADRVLLALFALVGTYSISYSNLIQNVF
jgi:hypothetical protein